MLITIWYELLFKLRVYVDGLVTRKKVLLKSGNRIYTHIYVVLEVLKVRISFSFELCLDEEFI